MLNKIPIGLAIIASFLTYTYVFAQLTMNQPKILVVTMTPVPTVAMETPIAEASPSPLSTPTPNSSTQNTTFTLAELSTHKQTGDCYVSYSGIVYDVSNNFSWQGCVHKGVKGGQDITAIFPHPTSYLATLKKVGIYTGPIGTPGNFNSERETDD